jgi:hypothetical protein
MHPRLGTSWSGISVIEEVMSYNERLASRVRAILGTSPGLVEKKMFGGVGFMIHGNMACGVHKDALIARVGRQHNAESLARPHARPFDLTGKQMEGWVVVDPGGYASDDELRDSVLEVVDFALTLPAK